MSIATLKRKTKAQYNNSSVGHPQFSLNGTRRSAGYVGQDMLGRSLVRSLAKGGVLRGHGGCCGKYPTPQIKTSPEMACLNDTSVIKPSSLSTNGLFMTKYRWIRRPQPFSTIKPDDTLHNNIQSVYIDNLSRNAILDGSNCHIIGSDIKPYCCESNVTNYNVKSHLNKPISKPDSFLGAITASDHILTLNKKCAVDNEIKHLNPNRNVPFACGNRNSFVPLFPNRNDILTPGIISGTNTLP